MDTYTEDLPYCDQQEHYGGVASKVWYGSVDDFSKITLPEHNSFESRKIIKKNEVTLYGGKTLKYIEVYLDKNPLTEKTQGSTRKQRLVSEFSFSVLGMVARNMGFVSHLKNKGMVFLIPDNNGTIWMLGTKKNAAYCADAQSVSGQQPQDDNMVNIRYTAHTELFVYNGNIEDIQAIGGFSSGFTKGFRV